VIVCPGPDYDRLGPELTPHREGLTRCKLQMLRVASPGGRRYRPALLTGLSLLRYPGYDEQPASGALRARVEAERPELIAAGVHLIVTQLPGGTSCWATRTSTATPSRRSAPSAWTSSSWPRRGSCWAPRG
jgi:hypothetical protein